MSDATRCRSFDGQSRRTIRGGIRKDAQDGVDGDAAPQSTRTGGLIPRFVRNVEGIHE